MIIDTTLHLANDIMNTLRFAEVTTGKTRSEIIILLMKILLKRYEKLYCASRRIQYQQRKGYLEWNRVHVVLLSREYEFLLDMRKFFKKSVSFLISLALSLYIDEILNDNSDQENHDNYQFKHYIVINELIDNVICWKIYWGLPEHWQIHLNMAS